MQRDRTIIVAALAIAVVVGAGAFAAFGTAGAQQDVQTTNDTTDSADRTIHVSATGSADAEPDQGVARVAVTAEGESLQTVREDLATGTEDLTAALDDLGVEYETTDYSVRESHDPHDERDVPEVAGQHTFEVTFDDPEMAGEVVDAVAGADAQVRDIELTLSEQTREQLRDEAIQNAMADARQQADTVADAGGLAVAGVQTVDASQRDYHPVELDGAAYESAQDDAAEPPTAIAAGDVSVTYTVDVTYTASDA